MSSQKVGTLRCVQSSLGRYVAWVQELDGSMAFGDTKQEAVKAAEKFAKARGYEVVTP